MPSLNEIVHQPVRLQIMALLAALSEDAEVDFTFLARQLSLTDGNLGAHLDKLQAAGYLVARKMFVGRKPRTSVHLTLPGRRAYEDYLAALRSIVDVRPPASN